MYDQKDAHGDFLESGMVIKADVMLRACVPFYLSPILDRRARCWILLLYSLFFFEARHITNSQFFFRDNQQEMFLILLTNCKK